MTKCQNCSKLANRCFYRLFSTSISQNAYANHTKESEKKTHFGFETVTEAEKEEKGKLALDRVS